MQGQESLNQLRKGIHASIYRIRRSVRLTKQLLQQLHIGSEIDQTGPKKRIVNKPR